MLNLEDVYDEAALKRIHNDAGLVTPDGMPLVWLGRLRRQPIDRVYGPDLLLATCERTATKGVRHYFLGGAPGVPELLAEKLRQRFPALVVAGTCSPPFRPLSEEEDRELCARIDDAHADIVWVGFGAPKQERWMAAHRDRLAAPVLIGVGAAFDFHAGLKSQAPRFLQRSGLEWLYRLATEPRRLWKRYLINNPWFLWLTALQILGLRRFPLER